MRFTVIWQNEAQDDATNHWLAAPDRGAITAAANQIDRELADDPNQKGEVLREGLRVLNVAPLRAIYDVNEGDRKVVVRRILLQNE